MNSQIKPSLWFDGNAEEAVDYYVSVFPDSKIVNILNYPKSAEEGLADFQQNMAGKVLVIDFELSNKSFMAINAGPEFKFNEAVSFVVSCQDQSEIDYFWEKLSSVPAAEQCGWCKDRFGLSWQVVPANMNDLMKRPDAYSHLMQMKKLVIADF